MQLLNYHYNEDYPVLTERSLNGSYTKLVETQLHEVSMKRKLQFHLIIKEMKLEDQKAIIKTKDNLGKEQKKKGDWRKGEGENKGS